MIHLLAVSVCDDYLLNLINKSSIEQTLDVEKDNENDSKDKSFEFDNFDDEYLSSSTNQFINNHFFFKQENLLLASFHYLQISLPQRINEILIPPPRA